MISNTINECKADPPAKKEATSFNNSFTAPASSWTVVEEGTQQICPLNNTALDIPIAVAIERDDFPFAINIDDRKPRARLRSEDEDDKFDSSMFDKFGIDMGLVLRRFEADLCALQEIEADAEIPYPPFALASEYHAYYFEDESVVPLLNITPPLTEVVEGPNCGKICRHEKVLGDHYPITVFEDNIYVMEELPGLPSNCLEQLMDPTPLFLKHHPEVDIPFIQMSPLRKPFKGTFAGKNGNTLVVKNLKRQIKEVQHMVINSGLVLKTREDWVLSSVDYTLFGELSVIRVQNKFYVCHTEIWDVPDLHNAYWIILAAMSYDYPELGSDELGVIGSKRVMIYYMLLAQNSYTAIQFYLHLITNLHRIHEDYKKGMPIYELPKDNYLIWPESVANFAVFKAQTRMTSLGKWLHTVPFEKRHITMALMICFLPGVHPAEVCPKPRESSMYLFIVFLISILQTCYMLFIHKRRVKEKLDELLAAEEGTSTKIDIAVKKAKTLFSESRELDVRYFSSESGFWRHVGRDWRWNNRIFNLPRELQFVERVLNSCMREVQLNFYHQWASYLFDKFTVLAAHAAFALVVYALRKSRVKMGIAMGCWATYAGFSIDDMFSPDVDPHIWRLMSQSTIEDVTAEFKAVKHSQYATALSNTLSFVIEKMLGFSARCYLTDLCKGVNLVEDVLLIITASSKALVAMYYGAPLSDVCALLIRNEDDSFFIYCESLASGVLSGQIFVGDSKETRQTVMASYEKLRSSLIEKAKLGHHSQRYVTTSRLIMVNKWIDELHSKEIDGKPKMQPFTVTLYGTGGIGKSHSIEVIQDMLHNLLLQRSPKKFEPKVGTYNPGDAYDSNLDSATTCIQINDLGIAKSDKRSVSQLEVMQRMSDSVITAYVKADVESKGKSFNLASFIVITTNAQDGGLVQEANDPEAAIRRLGVKIHMTPRKECMDSSGKIDKSKMHNDPGCPSQHCLYRAYDLRGTRVKETEHGIEHELTPGLERAYLTNLLDDKQIMSYIKKEFLKHLENHERATKAKTISEFCTKCDLPDRACECVRDSIPDYKENWSSTDDKRIFPKNPRKYYGKTADVPRYRKEFGNLLTPRETIMRHVYSYIFDLLNYYSGNKILRYKNYIISWKYTAIVCIYLCCGLLVSYNHLWNDVLVVSKEEKKLFRFGPTRKYDVVEIKAEVNPLAIIILISFIFQIGFYRWLRFMTYKIVYYPEYLPTDDPHGVRYVLPYTLTSKHIFSLFSIITAFVAIRATFRRITDLYVNMSSAVALFSESSESDKGAGAAVCANFDERKEELKFRDENPNLNYMWAPTRFINPEIPMSAKGIILDDLERLVKKNLIQIKIASDSSIMTTHALWIATGYLLLPLHAVLPARQSKLSITFLDQNKYRSEFPDALRCVDMEDEDLCLMSWNSGSKTDLLKFIALSPAKGDFQARLVGFDYDFESKISRPVFATRRDFSAHKASKMLSGYCYNIDTWQGMCGSVLISPTSPGATICGFHSGGDGKEGGAVALLGNKICDAMDKLQKKFAAAISPTEISPIKQVVGYEKVVSPNLHFRNPANYVPLFPGVEIEHYGDVGKDFTPQPRAKVNKNIDIAKKVFEGEDFSMLPANTKAKLPWNELAMHTTAQLPPVEPELINYAVDDYLSLDFDDLIAKAAIHKPYLKYREYTLDEALNGINGHLYRSAIRASTSAGFPFNTLKSKVLVGEPGAWSLDPVMESDLQQALCDLQSGRRTGLVFKVTPKDEARDVGKENSPRLFQAGNILSLLIQIMTLGPAIDFMTAFPSEFEIAIGVNPHDISWHVVVAKAFAKYDKGFEMDYSKYDQTQHPDIKKAVAKVLSKLMVILTGNDSKQAFYERVCSEFTNPLVNLNGGILELDNLMPSGTFTTAHGNCIYNSLITRMSVYKICKEQLPFREHISFRCLGDDNGGSFTNYIYDKGWNQLSFSKFAQSLGMKATNGGKQDFTSEYIDSRTIEFLGRTTVYHSDRGHCVGRLRKKSLFKSLAVVVPSTECYEVKMDGVLTSLYYEVLNYDMEYARSIYVKIKRFCELINIAVNPACIDPIFQLREYQPKISYARHLGDMGFPPNLFVAKKSESREISSDSNSAGDGGEALEIVSAPEVDVVVERNTAVVIPETTYGHLSNYLDREYEVYSTTFQLNTFHSDYISPFAALLHHEVLRKKLDNIALLRCDIELRFVCSATLSHSGSFILSYLPLENTSSFQDETQAPASLRYVLMTSRQHAILRLGQEDMEVKMVIPFVYWDPFVNPKDLDVLSDLGELTIATASPMEHAMSDSMPVFLRVYAKMVNYKLSGATAYRSEAEAPIEAYSSKVSVMSNMAGKASSLFGAIYPPLAIPASIASDALDGIAGIARLFGHSKPLVSDMGSVIPSLSGPLCATNVNLPAKTLALDFNQGVSLSGMAGGCSSHDTLSHDYLLGKKVLAGVWKVSDSDTVDSKVFECGVTPAFAIRDKGETILTPMGMVASQYNLWCGTIHYEVVISRCSNYGGKFMLYHDPITQENLRPETNKSLLFDIRDTNNIEIEVGWTSSKLMLKTNGVSQEGFLYEPLVLGHAEGFTNGVLTLSIESPIVGTGLSPASVYVELYTWASMDTVFADRIDYLQNYKFKDDLEINEPRVPPHRNLEAIGFPLTTLGPSLRTGNMVSPIYDIPRIEVEHTGPPSQPNPSSSEPPPAPPDPVEPTFWPSIFPKKTSAPVAKTAAPVQSKAPSLKPSLPTAVPVKLPTKSPTSLPVKLPTPAPFPTTCTEFQLVDVTPWIIGGDGSPGMVNGARVMRLFNSTSIYLPNYGAVHSPEITFTGTLRVNGNLVPNNKYFVPANNGNVAGGIGRRIDVTGSEANITAVKISIPLRGYIKEITPAMFKASVPNNAGATLTEMSLADGSVVPAFKSVGASAGQAKMFSSPPPNCAVHHFRSIVYEGYFQDASGTLQGQVHENKTSAVSRIEAGTSLLWVSGGSPGVLVAAGFLLDRTLTSESRVTSFHSESRVSPKTPTKFLIGSPPNTTEVLAICGGERMNSLRSLLQIVFPDTMYNSTRASEAVVFTSESLHFTNVGNFIDLYRFLLRSHIGVRGGMMKHIHVVGPGNATVMIFRPSAAIGMPTTSNRGFEIVDSRVNPFISVKVPYYSPLYFYLCRSSYQPESTSLPEIGLRIHRMGDGEVDIIVHTSIAEDFSLIQFVGSPILVDK